MKHLFLNPGQLLQVKSLPELLWLKLAAETTKTRKTLSSSCCDAIEACDQAMELQARVSHTKLSSFRWHSVKLRQASLMPSLRVLHRLTLRCFWLSVRRLWKAFIKVRRNICLKPFSLTYNFSLSLSTFVSFSKRRSFHRSTWHYEIHHATYRRRSLEFSRWNGGSSRLFATRYAWSEDYGVLSSRRYVHLERRLRDNYG